MLETYAGARRQFLEAFPGIGMRVWGNEDLSKMFFAVCDDEQIDYRTYGFMWRGQFENSTCLAQRIQDVEKDLTGIGILRPH
jgi:hypothetical protein